MAEKVAIKVLYAILLMVVILIFLNIFVALAQGEGERGEVDRRRLKWLYIAIAVVSLVGIGNCFFN